MAIRVVLGQQVSTAAARTLTATLVLEAGEPVVDPRGGLTHLFPEPVAITKALERDDTILRVPATRRRTVSALSRALAEGIVDVGPGGDWTRARANLASIPGIGPWSVEMIALRAWGDPDAFPISDLGVKRGAEALEIDSTPAHLEHHATRWRPWRAYATQYLWAGTDHPVNHFPPDPSDNQKRSSSRP
jgi:AraC family transcriptional regulator of adaptative response / DNA-3-methyladenine glycosylase II